MTHFTYIDASVLCQMAYDLSKIMSGVEPLEPQPFATIGEKEALIQNQT